MPPSRTTPPANGPRRRIVVIGGGIAGLVAASTLARDGSSPEVTLLEASDELGGKIRGVQGSDGSRLELGPDAFLAEAKPAATRLARELGLDLVAPGPLASRTYLWFGGRLRPLPRGLAMGVPTSPLSLAGAVAHGVISPGAALRAAIEPLLPASVGRSAAEPSVEAVCRARLGLGVTERLVAPLIGGIFGAPPDEIGMTSAFPRFDAHRSLVMSMLRRGPSASGPMFLAPRGGMSDLVDAVVARLENVETRTGVAAQRITRVDGGWQVVPANGDPIDAAAVILAVPPTVAAGLLTDAAPVAAGDLRSTRMSSSAIVLLRYPRRSIAHRLDASGFLVGSAGEATIAGATFLSAKWPHAGWNDPWIRAFVTDPAALAKTDDELTRAVAADLGMIAGAPPDPAEVLLHRWAEALPIQEPGYRERIARAGEALPEGLIVAGAAYLGSGIPDAVSSGSEAAAAARSVVERGL